MLKPGTETFDKFDFSTFLMLPNERKNTENLGSIQDNHYLGRNVAAQFDQL